MITPEQIEEISFGRARFGGYDMEDVDKFLDPLCEDYITLYKENASLKSKMRVLVAKLEEYRAAEASMKEAVLSAQKTCDTMIAEAQAKCAGMVNDAQAAAVAADAQIAAENARVEQARQVAARQIEDLQEQLESCVRLLGEIKENHRPAVMPEKETAPAKSAADMVDEIAANLEALVDLDSAPETSDALPPLNTDSLSGKFANLQFGKNYQPDNK